VVGGPAGLGAARARERIVEGRRTSGATWGDYSVARSSSTDGENVGGAGLWTSS